MYTVMMSFNKVFMIAVKRIAYDRYDDDLASVESNGLNYTTTKVRTHIDIATPRSKTLIETGQERVVVMLTSR